MAAAAYTMLSVAEATEVALAHAPALPAVTATLADCLGRVLAEDVKAPEPLPPFPASMKDGYAVVAADGPGEYPVIAEVRTGASAESVQVTPGTVTYITTGSPLPAGADAVVMVELSEKLPPGADGVPRVAIKQAVKAGDDVRPIGCDIMADDIVLATGELLGAAEVGLLATVGAASFKVFPQPHVALMSTGDEVVEPSSQALEHGQIRDSNRAMLVAACQGAGARVTDLGIARDAEGQLEGLLDKAIQEGVNILVTSGGVSMGDKDLIKPLLERRGTVHYGRVKMKPGKPLTFATVEIGEGASARRMLVFGLPGNPVSSLVTFHLVCVPTIRKMSGWADPSLRRVNVRLGRALKLDPQRPEYHRATVKWVPFPDGTYGGELVAESTGGQLSSRLLSARSANALLELPAAEGVIPQGAVVSALLIGDLCAMPVVPGGVGMTPLPAEATVKAHDPCKC
mmetsp:Transcript_30274/g.77729  ORF Transcript_30274/g.77729 Transcript_30274/m.77729 type:complete len:457 (+) Transcript_30274:179-1549(+)